jgi:hypothetical protein
MMALLEKRLFAPRDEPDMRLLDYADKLDNLEWLVHISEQCPSPICAISTSL